MRRSKVISVDGEGAVFRIRGEIVSVNFADCAKNFKLISGGSGHSVGTHNIKNYRVVFYSEPRVELRFRGLFASRKFHSLLKRVEGTGYRLFDIS